MSKRIPLDALVRRVSRMAKQMFDRQGDIYPMWLVENASGEQHVIVSPIIAESPLVAHDVKDRIAAEMRAHFAENDIVRYAHAMEAWTLHKPEQREMTTEQAALEYAAMGDTLANHPNRREIVIFEADDGTELLTALRDIIRPPHGKPYLGKLGPIERMDHISGRWLNLLPNKGHAEALRERPPAQGPQKVRRSSELPADVGAVFVTAVPNMPLQVMGRRDPATGDLCVSKVIWLSKDALWPLVDLPSWVETVTGPEAERLVLAVHYDYTKQPRPRASHSHNSW
jgi:hypothetical protein